MMIKTNKNKNEFIRIMRKELNNVTFNIPEVMMVDYGDRTLPLTPCSVYNFTFKTDKGTFVLGYDGTYDEWVDNYEYVSSEMYLLYDDGEIRVIGEDGEDYGVLVDAEFLYETNRPKYENIN